MNPGHAAFAGIALALGATIEELDALWTHCLAMEVPSSPGAVAQQILDAIRDLRRLRDPKRQIGVVVTHRER